MTNQKEIIDGAYGGLPVMYETKKAPKSKIIESELYKADIAGFNSKVGFLTNLSTTMYSMLPLHKEGSDEYNEIIRRLKQCRKEQGSIIDGAKGLVIKPIPSRWTNWQKNDENDAQINFYNSILINKRPQFMQHLYSAYSKKYLQHFNNFNAVSIGKFNLELKDLLNIQKSDLNESQSLFLAAFYKFNPLLDSDCEMNRISKYMQCQIKAIRQKNKFENTDERIRVLKSPDADIDRKKLKDLYDIYKRYKAGKRNFDRIDDERGEQRFKTLDQYYKSIRQESLAISSDICELATIAVCICYEVHKSDNKSFAWSIFGDGIIENIKANSSGKISVPFLDENGEIEYLGLKYHRRETSYIDNNDINYLL